MADGEAPRPRRAAGRRARRGRGLAGAVVAENHRAERKSGPFPQRDERSRRTEATLRIAYGVHGYGRGHATRALTVLPELTKRHEVLVLAGGDAHDPLAADYDVVRVPYVRYYYRRPGKRSTYLTATHGISAIMDIRFAGPSVQMAMDVYQKFEPDVVLSDSEPWSLRAGRLMGIPRIMFDHYGIMAYCRPPVRWWGRLACWLEAPFYQALMGYPERVIVTAFFDAPPRRPGVHVVGSILRPVVRDFEPSDGDHLLVYFSSGRLHYTPTVEAALQRLDAPVVVYGKERTGRDGNIDYRPIANRPFVCDLASCRAVFSTAGNQLIGEAMYFGKPVLALPEDSLEQHVNADVVEHLGIGMRTSDRKFSAAVLDRFLARKEQFAANVRRHFRDGVADAVETIERYIDELTAGG